MADLQKHDLFSCPPFCVVIFEQKFIRSAGLLASEANKFAWDWDPRVRGSLVKLACDFYEAEKPKSRPSCDLFWFCKVKFSSMVLKNFEVFKFQSQKCFWSKFKCRHGCYNPQRIICNHLKLWISWDAQEIKRFSISFGGDIFFATGGSWSQQLISSIRSNFGIFWPLQVQNWT